MGNSGQRQFLQRIGRRRRPRRRGSFPTAACSVPYRRRCRRRPIRCKNCRCPELPTCPEFPPFTLIISKACKLSCSIAVSLSFTERSSSTKHAQKYHGTTTTRRSRKNGGKQEALALTGYSASYSQKTRGGPQEPSSSCEQIAYRAPGRRSAPPARSTTAPAKHAYITISKSQDYAWKSSTIPILKERRRTV